MVRWLNVVTFLWMRYAFVLIHPFAVICVKRFLLKRTSQYALQYDKCLAVFIIFVG